MTEQRIGPDKEVTLHFALGLETGELVDSTFDKKPATFKVGDGNCCRVSSSSSMG